MIIWGKVHAVFNCLSDKHRRSIDDHPLLCPMGCLPSSSTSSQPLPAGASPPFGVLWRIHIPRCFFKLFPQTSVVLSPGQASSLIAASQFRHDIVVMAFCHGTGTASAALLISRSLTWILQSFLFGMSFWNNCHLHLFFHSCSPESWLQKSSRHIEPLPNRTAQCAVAEASDLQPCIAHQ